MNWTRCYLVKALANLLFKYTFFRVARWEEIYLMLLKKICNNEGSDEIEYICACSPVVNIHGCSRRTREPPRAVNHLILTALLFFARAVCE